MDSSLSGTETWSLLALSMASSAVLANTFQGDGEPLIAALAFSCIAFAFTFSLIRWLGPTFMKANLKGRDMSKPKKVEMSVSSQISTSRRTLGWLIDPPRPENMGAVCAIVYLLSVIIFIPFPFYKDIIAATANNHAVNQHPEELHTQLGRVLHRFPHSKVLILHTFVDTANNSTS